MPMMWPTLAVQNVERALSFYRDQLGLEQDLDLRDETGALFLASVEVDDTVIMLSRAHPGAPAEPQRSGVRLTLLFDRGHDVDALLEHLIGRGAVVCSPIGDRPWGHRDFTVFDPDGYHVTIARPLDPA
jgi:uncharacterized glyoxalase superfamily protein PhnB